MFLMFSEKEENGMRNKYRASPVQWVKAILLMYSLHIHTSLRPLSSVLLYKNSSFYPETECCFLFSLAYHTNKRNIIKTSMFIICNINVTLFLFPFFSCSSCNPKISPEAIECVYLIRKMFLAVHNITQDQHKYCEDNFPCVVSGGLSWAVRQPLINTRLVTKLKRLKKFVENDDEDDEKSCKAQNHG